MPRTEVPKPTYAQNMRIIGHTDQDGRADGQQIMVRNGCAYIGLAGGLRQEIGDGADMSRRTSR